MRQRHRWWVLVVLILPLVNSGCDTGRQSSTPLLNDNGRFMDLWRIYTRCSHGEDLDAMRLDAQRLSLAGNMPLSLFGSPKWRMGRLGSFLCSPNAHTRKGEQGLVG